MYSMSIKISANHFLIIHLRSDKDLPRSIRLGIILFLLTMSHSFSVSVTRSLKDSTSAKRTTIKARYSWRRFSRLIWSVIRIRNSETSLFKLEFASVSLSISAERLRFYIARYKPSLQVTRLWADSVTRRSPSCNDHFSFCTPTWCHSGYRTLPRFFQSYMIASLLLFIQFNGLHEVVRLCLELVVACV